MALKIEIAMKKINRFVYRHLILFFVVNIIKLKGKLQIRSKYLLPFLMSKLVFLQGMQCALFPAYMDAVVILLRC